MNATEIHPKVAMVGIGGAIAVILIWAFQSQTGMDVPSEVVASFTTICTFFAGYFTASPEPLSTPTP